MKAEIHSLDQTSIQNIGEFCSCRYLGVLLENDLKG
jgi:hypothetical protein